MDLKNYLQTHKKTHLIFDLDRTLVHLILPWNLWEEEIKDELIRVDKVIYDNYLSHKITLSQMENSYVKKYSKMKNLVIKNSVDFETKYLKDIVVNNQLVNFVKKASDYEIYLWSGNTRKTATKILKKLGILPKFKKLVTRSDVSLLKPEIEGFVQIYNPKTPKEDYLFIGDSNLDRQAAESAGIDFYLEEYFK